MQGLYQELAYRLVETANYITYVDGTLHPDRILTVHDIVYILEGQWEVTQNNIPYHLEPDDVILLHAGQHHGGTVPCTPNTKTMYIHYTAAERDCFLAGESNNPKDGLLSLPVVISCRQHLAVKSRFQDIISIQWTDSPRKSQKLSALLALLMNELAECQYNLAGQEDKTATQIAEFLHANPDHFYTGEELAEHFFISERTLRNHFQQRYRQSIYQYQVHTKLQMACEFMMTHPEAKLSEVAHNFGFCDEFHFSKLFKKKYALPPGKWRNQN